MRVINPLSKEIVKFIGVDMIHGVYSIEYQENKFAQPSTMLVPINLDATTTESFLKTFFEYLKTVDAEYVDYVEDTEYMGCLRKRNFLSIIYRIGSSSLINKLLTLLLTSLR